MSEYIDILHKPLSKLECGGDRDVSGISYAMSQCRSLSRRNLRIGRQRDLEHSAGEREESGTRNSAGKKA